MYTNEDWLTIGEPEVTPDPLNGYYFGEFQSDNEHFDFDNYNGDVGFPDGQFMAHLGDYEESAYLAECWRDGNTDGAEDLISQIADHEKRDRVQRVWGTVSNIPPINELTQFPWE